MPAPDRRIASSPAAPTAIQAAGSDSMNLWRAKLLALLHDPPHKPAAIRDHENQRASFLNRLGLPPDAFIEFERSHDWQAAAADRLFFPKPGPSGLCVDWTENAHEFRHPLGGGVRRAPHLKPGVFEEKFTSALDGIAPESEDWRKKFILAWRLWRERSAREMDGHYAFIVADTRIPDHTLWHHNALTAAFAACESRPAFLLFQIGPVQDFIAQARKTADLWSGSYLLSFLIAEAMLAIAEEIGPDAIIYPQLRGVPLADLRWQELDILAEDQRLAASHTNELLTPALPNRFLVIVPARRAAELAQLAETAVRKKWAGEKGIAESVKDFIGERLGGSCHGWEKHWDEQVARFPQIDWITHEWSSAPDAMAAVARENDPMPPLHGGWDEHPLRHAHRWATEFMPSEHRESYRPDSQPASAWALHYAAAEWKFAALKSARAFAPWREFGKSEADGVPKDHLDGRSEVLGGTEHEKFWQTLAKAAPTYFKPKQRYGALTVIKRLWGKTFLRRKLKLASGTPVFVPVDELVRRFVERVDTAAENEGEAGAAPDEQTYYAILAMDGDDMGKWLSGAMAPPIASQVAEQAANYLREHWPKERADMRPFDKVLRPLSPGYHAALSEALGNFGLYCAGPIIRAFGGQPIYTGGDDVLAMLPAGGALDCAQALVLAFRGFHPDDTEAHASDTVKRVFHDIFEFPPLADNHPKGFLTLRRGEGKHVGRAENLKPNWPLIVPGPRAKASVGIAIGHVHSPMQDTIQAAREAEAAAKLRDGKAAFRLDVRKRSGEGVAFTAAWKDAVVAVWAELAQCSADFSRALAHDYGARLKELLIIGGSATGASYVKKWNVELADAAEAELRHLLRRRGASDADHARGIAARWRAALIGDLTAPALPPRDYLHFWLAWAFIRRLPRENPDRT